MIDTIVLLLTRDHYHISEPDKFTPSAAFLLSESLHKQGYLQAKQNPTKKKLACGIYKPRLTLYNRSASGIRHITLKIELSLPKLLFGNNFSELRYKDFTALLEKLMVVLASMGVIVTQNDLANAGISAIHYSKNFCFTDGLTPYHFIHKIKETNSKLSLDINQTDYRNEGHSYKWHCNSYEVVFYDKIRDLEKAKQSSKRALEKDSVVQLQLLNTLRRDKKFEVLRMEVRLNKRQKIKQLFATLNIKNDLTFKKLFKPAISKKILLHYLDELEKRRPVLIDYQASHDKALLTDLIFNNPDSSPKQILQLFGLKKALETMNVRELRTMFARYNKRSWNRLIAEVHKIHLPLGKQTLQELRNQLEAFKPLKLKVQ